MAITPREPSAEFPIRFCVAVCRGAFYECVDHGFEVSTP